MYKYQTDFQLIEPVIDVDAAREYLDEDMAQYLDGDLINKIKSIRYYLDDEQNGCIIVISEEELTDEEMENTSEYIRGQNADGLGEGFEQQPFAEYDASLYYDGKYDPTLIHEDDYEEDWIMASFDWRTNRYPLELIEHD